MTAYNRRAILAGAAATPLLAAPNVAAAQTAREIDVGVDAALAELFTLPGGRALYNRSAGALIIPEVTQGGLIIGAAFGEGALRIVGATDSYWRYRSASIGYQIGVQRTRQALLFMTADALRRFRAGSGWEVGVDVEVTLIDTGGGVDLDTTQETAPVVGFVYGREGLLAGASLQGGRYTRFRPR